jgi:parallel beta-helix repeat protein
LFNKKVTKMKKNITILFVIAFLCGIALNGYSQTEVKGSGTTGATFTFITKNASNDTSLVVLDDGKVGIDTTSPVNKLDVNGTVGAYGGVRFGDGTLQTTAATGGVAYAQVFTVALAGGDFTSINAALGACAGAGPGNPYLIRVMPGTWIEHINCIPYVHMKGAGKYVTNIIGRVTAADNVVIEDFYIEAGIMCFGTSPTIIHNIIRGYDIPGTGFTDGIHITPPGRPWIKENEIIDCPGWGINCNGFGADPWIIANKIRYNGTDPINSGGIACISASPTISNNFIDSNHYFGIYLYGLEGLPAEPTIDDNVIGHTDYYTGGRGIYMSGFAEPRIIANDIYLNGIGIWVLNNTQPSIIGNNINYNYDIGIGVLSMGASKVPVIMGNHLHSNVHTPMGAGIFVSTSPVMISNNNITQNDAVNIPRIWADIDYSTSMGPFPMISLNVFDIIKFPGMGATGNYNVTSAGAPIAP